MRLGVPAHIGDANTDARDDARARQGIAAKLLEQLHEQRSHDALMRPGRRDHVDDLPVLVQFPPFRQARPSRQIAPTLHERFGGERLVSETCTHDDPRCRASGHRCERG